MTQQTKHLPTLPHPAEELIMHRPPMLLIDQLVERVGDRAVASAHLDSSSICFSNTRGILQEYFIEIIAQTMAAANGFDALAQNSPPKIGFIVGIDDFTLKQVPDHSSDFLIKIAKNMEFGAMKVMEGEVFNGTTSIATVEMKVWEQDRDEDDK